MKTLTVITTTFNRAYCLHQVYDSLCEQSCSDFLWLIIDDGSSDQTRELVEEWMLENRIEIEYYYKENGGMHTARNLAYEKVHTELNVIIDSDDWMKDDGVERIVGFWKKNKNERFAGIVFNNVSPDGTLIGTELPKNIVSCTITDLFGRYGVQKDRKLVYRSELSRLYPYPEFPGEKFYPPSLKFFFLDQDYEMLLCNTPVCVVNYNDDSMTRDKFAQYKNSAKGFAHYRNEISKLSHSPKFVLQQMTHYIAESKLAGEKEILKKAHRKMSAIICWIPGNLLYYYLKNTKKKY